MSKIIPNLAKGRICLISFIILCSEFMSENAFSMPWNKRMVEVIINPKVSICISFLFHQYREPGNHGYLSSCDFFYSEDGKTNLTKLISVSTINQYDKDQLSILIRHKQIGENVKLFSRIDMTHGVQLPDDNDFTYHARAKKFIIPNVPIDRATYIAFYWDLVKSGKRVNFIKVVGLWCADGASQCERIEEFYPPIIVKSNPNTMKNTPSELNQAIRDKVKVAGDTDAINLTGAESGESIKIYTVAGVEVKSVVANDDVVNIKLPKNQIYIVKVGQANYKVAL